MGDISRHRDIFLNTLAATPKELLSKCKIDSLGYIELGNFLTDVSQFRDPVAYIFAKRKVWRESIVSGVGKDARVQAIEGLTALAAIAAAAAIGLTKKSPYAALPLAVLPVEALLADQFHDAIAGLLGLDDWIDKMLGVPAEKLRTQDSRRADKDYGYLGLYFLHFIEGITQLLFADEVPNKVKGVWGTIPRLPETKVAEVFKAYYTQYYPHEHTDQPPYVWDASERTKPKNATWYGKSTRQATLVSTGGVMNAVDKHYIQYQSERLTQLEAEFRAFKDTDLDGRRLWLARVGKVLHSVEDWYFHSNVVEILRLQSYRPEQGAAEDGEAFLKRFVEAELKDAEPQHRVELRRKLFRRLRFPVYSKGTKIEPSGIASTQTSTLSLDHAYPAFPSQQDTAHTLLGALENLELKGKSATHNTGGIGQNLDKASPWLTCALLKFQEQTTHGRDFFVKRTLERAKATPGASAKEIEEAVIIDAVRELVPLILTLLYESERQRLVADVSPDEWPVSGDKPKKSKNREKSDIEQKAQIERHRKALEPRADKNGKMENNYERLVRYVQECGYLNALGRDALIEAFKVDIESQKLNAQAPGAGGFLLQFAIQLQEAMDQSDAASAAQNKKPSSVFEPATDNGSFNEIIGSHSLMSKDTPTSFPFFDDARVLGSVASLSVLHMLLEEVSSPLQEKGLDWQRVLWFLIRYPGKTGGWERKALAFFKQQGTIPKYADLPELAEVAKGARVDRKALEERRKGTKARDLEQEYIDLEKKVSHYRYPQ